jgi:WD40 repeat protein
LIELPTNSRIQLVDACLPISALKTFDWNEKNFIFQGQGPLFRVIDDRTGNLAAQVQIFRRNNVHGFIILPQRGHGHRKDNVRILVWGGRSLRAVDLTLGFDDEVTLCLSSAEFQAPDWIMSGCAAVADQPDTAYLVTANNALLSSKILPAISSKYRFTFSIFQLATSVKCILYAVDLIALSPSHVLIAAGTVFGEIIVWSCFIEANEPSKANAVGSIHHYFTGHDGSIFGVRISPNLPSLNGEKSGRLLASCSDDRTIRIWDISDCENKSSHDPSAYSTDGFELRGTGFGATQGDPGLRAESCVAKAFGHISRIWSVNFRPLRDDQPNKMGMVSRSEDATCVVWDLTWESDPGGTTKYDLHETFSNHLHSGKNLWSLDLCSRGDDTAVYSGGADGALNSFIVTETCDTELGPSNEHGDLTTGRPSKIGTKAFGFVSPDCFVACSANAELQLGHIDAEENAKITWETLCTAKDPRTFLLIAGFPQKRLALIGSGQGSFQMYRHDSKSLSHLVDIGGRPIGLIGLENSQPEALSFLAYYPTDNTATLVTVTELDSDSPKIEVITFSLPQAPFAVSAASLMCNDQYLMVGSKLGGLAVYRVSDLGMDSQPLVEDRRVHGRDATNHIQVVRSMEDSNATGPEYVLTCGRDGFFCLLELHPSDDGSVSLEALHRSYSGLAGNIGGAYFDQANGDLMIYGFRSQSFVLRNESKQMDVISIPSGGARRGWAFHPENGDNKAVFLWKDGHDMYTRRIRTDLNRCLRAGNHGREIKSMDSVDSVQGRQPLFATGSEDTTVRIFMPSSPASASPWGSFECLRTLDTHRTGIQQVSWSKDGRYLFTSSGFEEFFVWKVKIVPSFGLATILLAASPKDDPKSELRVTCFDMVEVGDPGAGQEFLLCLTLSNSTFKVS